MIALYSYYLESTLGTVRWMTKIIFSSFLLGTFLTLLYLVHFRFLNPTMFGIGSIFFLDISQRCFSNAHNVSGILFFPIPIKNIYIPFMILLINFLFSGQLFQADIASIILGYALA